MTFPSSKTNLLALSTLICTSLAACGGGGGDGAGSGSVTAALVVAKPVAGPTTAASEPTVATPVITTPTASTAVAAAPVAQTAPIVSSTVAAVTATTASATTTAGAQVGTPSTLGVSYGNYLHPYAVSSLWNLRPVNPVFGTFVIPSSTYFPSIAAGGYSTGVFLAAATDLPMTIVGPASTATVTAGVADPDSGGSRVITIPHWPAGVLPASGTDGHADIVDPVTNTIHSFWQLKQVNGRWTAALYSWSKLNGTGWGDPAHAYQGARAVGIPASAGLIRKQELDDGLPTYSHALTMSLTYNALSNGVNSPAYVFPATSADNSLSSNSGAIPEGALMMLPPTFDSSKIANPALRKIVETLKVYGAYVVDRNVGTPFTITVENDSGFNLMPKGWDNTIAGQLDTIRASLRQVVSAQAWVDANGESAAGAIKAQQDMNILSMRGPWYKQSGTAAVTYDSTTQNLVFDASKTKTVQVNANNTGLTRTKWALPKTGDYVRFSVIASGGATLRMQVKTSTGATVDTRELANGQSMRFVWPASASVILIATSGTAGASTVRADLVPAP